MSNKLISEDFLLTFADMLEPEKPWYGRKLLDSKMLRYLAKRAPAVDAVEVIRCKDCTKCKPIKPTVGLPSYTCMKWFHWTNPEAFCSYGERRTDV